MMHRKKKKKSDAYITSCDEVIASFAFHARILQQSASASAWMCMPGHLSRPPGGGSLAAGTPPSYVHDTGRDGHLWAAHNRTSAVDSVWFCFLGTDSLRANLTPRGTCMSLRLPAREIQSTPRRFPEVGWEILARGATATGTGLLPQYLVQVIFLDSWRRFGLLVRTRLPFVATPAGPAAG